MKKSHREFLDSKDEYPRYKGCDTFSRASRRRNSFKPRGIRKGIFK